ncbi:MAG: GUN4 domain-containing protein, partial [Cyanobacteria bacterium P01_E01_bin.35]
TRGDDKDDTWRACPPFLPSLLPSLPPFFPPFIPSSLHHLPPFLPSLQHLKDWKSKYPNSNRSQQQQIEELTRQLRELQSSHDKQLAEIETTSQQEKEQIKQSYLTQIQELQQSNQDQQQLEKILTSQIQELEQQLQQAQSFLIAQQQVEQFLKSKIQQLEQLQPTTIVSEIVSKTEEVELRSARGVDYTKLYDLLKQKQWQEADEETAKLMLQAANRENSDLRIYDIENFPCEDLRTINNLWLQHSNSKFGFSVQDDIYVGLGASRESESQVWEQFGYLVGWRRGKHWREYEELTFDLNLAPQGHLPTVWMNLSAQNRTSFFFLLSFNL